MAAIVETVKKIKLREDKCPNCQMTLWITNWQEVDGYMLFDVKCCGCKYVNILKRKVRERKNQNGQG
jgi:Zn ribbon nucleic-acid-binding protein